MSFTESVNITIIILGNGLSATIIEAICTPLLNLSSTHIPINNSDGPFAYSEKCLLLCVKHFISCKQQFSFNRDIILSHFNII